MDRLWREEDEDGDDHTITAEVQVEEYEEDHEAVGGDAVHEVLPLEVMQHIVGLTDPSSVVRGERVCHAWRVMCRSTFVWEEVYRRHFSSASAPAKGPFYPLQILWCSFKLHFIVVICLTK
jgi:hypothetical protein